MKSLIKFLSLTLLICAPALAIDDGERKQQAEEAHPAKEEIAKTIAQTNIMPNVLAPVIASYAENPCKGYMFLVPVRAAQISVFIPGFLEKYQEDFPELAQNLTKDSVMLDTWVSSKERSLQGDYSSSELLWLHGDYNPKPWHAHDCPYLPSKSKGTNFPHQIPASFLKNLKENDLWYVTIKGIPFALKCSQLSHRYNMDHDGSLCPFEKRFAISTQDLLEPAKEEADEDQE